MRIYGPKEDLTGKTFGNLLATQWVAGGNGKKRSHWLCTCLLCGNEEARVPTNSLTKGIITACSCNQGWLGYHRTRVPKPKKEKVKKSRPPKKYRVLSSHGYVRLFEPEHPNADHTGRVYEHTFVMSKSLRRALVDNENVHHKNGDKQDNRLENLELWSTSQPYGQRVSDQVAWAKEIIALYEPLEESGVV